MGQISRNFHRALTKRMKYMHVTTLGHQGGEEFSDEGPHFLSYVQLIFPAGGEKISRGFLPPRAPSCLRTC